MLEMFKTAYPTICEIFNGEVAKNDSDYYPMIKLSQFTALVHRLELLPQDWSLKQKEICIDLIVKDTLSYMRHTEREKKEDYKERKESP